MHLRRDDRGAANASTRASRGGPTRRRARGSAERVVEGARRRCGSRVAFGRDHGRRRRDGERRPHHAGPDQRSRQSRLQFLLAVLPVLRRREDRGQLRPVARALAVDAGRRGRADRDRVLRVALRDRAARRRVSAVWRGARDLPERQLWQPGRFTAPLLRRFVRREPRPVAAAAAHRPMFVLPHGLYAGVLGAWQRDPGGRRSGRRVPHGWFLRRVRRAHAAREGEEGGGRGPPAAARGCGASGSPRRGVAVPPGLRRLERLRRPDAIFWRLPPFGLARAGRLVDRGRRRTRGGRGRLQPDRGAVPPSLLPASGPGRRRAGRTRVGRTLPEASRESPDVVLLADAVRHAAGAEHGGHVPVAERPRGRDPPGQDTARAVRRVRRALGAALQHVPVRLWAGRLLTYASL
mmetsp:Transcript_23638/g.70876  ORF Transcript_23638/g.70876 Transcript_23638/m.70876 type:complete len:407 (-) Transcript_23638:9-1229(-)